MVEIEEINKVTMSEYEILEITVDDSDTEKEILFEYHNSNIPYIFR